MLTEDTAVNNELQESEQAELTKENQPKVIDVDDDFMELEKSSRGKSSFVLNEDPDRPQTEFSGKETPTILRFSRNSANKKEGLFLATVQLSAFNVQPSAMEHGTQLTVVTMSGQKIVGYIVKTETRKGAYFPFRYLPTGIKLPTVGTKLPVKVAKLIIG